MRPGWVVPAVGVLLTLLVLRPFAGDMLRNDWNLWRLSRELGQAAHLPRSSRVAARRDFGLLIGNGNHCDFFAGEMRRFDGNRRRAEAFYRNVTVRNPVDGGRIGVRVAFFDEGRLPEYVAPYGLEHVAAWGGSVPDSQRYYLAYVFESYDDDQFCDIRCH